MSTDGDTRVNSAERVVMFPVDGSPHSERAFNWYVNNLKRENDLAKFVCVIEPAYTAPVIGLGAKSPSLPDVAQLMKESISAGEKLGHQCMQKAKLADVTSQAFLYVNSKPGPALVNFINEHKADMVVMGNRGIGALRRTFLGSVSDYVLHHAHVPVAIIPPHKSESK